MLISRGVGDVVVVGNSFRLCDGGCVITVCHGGNVC